MANNTETETGGSNVATARADGQGTAARGPLRIGKVKNKVLKLRLSQ